MKTAAKLDALYREIPAFTCKPGCTDCCGPVPWSKVEAARVNGETSFIGGNCVHSLTGKCDVYDRRPFICRLFGASSDPMLKCPHGCAPAQPLNAVQAENLTRRYIKLMEAS